MSFQQRRSIEEYKEVLAGEPQTFQCELLEQGAGRAVVIYRLQKEVVVADVRLPQGTVSFGYFWEARNYNLYHFVTAEGDTLALYFNISDSTRISAEQIYWRDLVVDILATPDGACRVLDEDEIPDDIPENLKRLIINTREDILQRLINLKLDTERETQTFTRSLRQSDGQS